MTRFKRLIACGCAMALALAPTMAHADPITAAIVTTIGLTGTAATVATFVINTALQMAAVAALSKLTGSKNKARAQERQASVTTLSLGETPREAVFGRVCTAGTLIDAFNFGGSYGTDWECLVMALADHEIDALEGYYVHDNYHAFTGNGGQAAFSNLLDIEFQNASMSPDSSASRFTTAGGWAVDDRLKGVTHIFMAYKFDEKVWPQGRPSFRFVMRGKKCYDPRLDSTVPGGSGAHRWDTPSTWTYTENAAVCRYNWVRGVYAGDQVGQAQHLLVGRGLSAEEAPPERIFAAANVCDEAVTLKAGGTESRYRVSAVIRADETYESTEQMFAAAMAGVIVQREGGVEIEPGMAKSTVAEITDSDLVVGEKVTFDAFLADTLRINTVVGSYVEPAQNWSSHAAPVRRSLTDIATDGRPREETLALGFVTSGAQAQRCAEIQRRLNRLEKRAGIVLPPRFSFLEEGDWIGWTSDRHHGGARVVYRVESWSRAPSWRRTLALREIAASAFTWTAATDEHTPGSAPSPEPALPGPLALGGVTISAFALPGSGGTAVPAIKAVWTTPVDPAVLGVRLEVRRLGEAETAATNAPRPGDGQMVTTNGVAPDAALQARVVPISDGGREVTPSTWTTMTAGSLTAAVAGVATSVIGQTAWATYAGFTPDQALKPGANVIFDAGLKLRGQTWTLNSWGYGYDPGIGGYIGQTSAGTEIAYTASFPVVGGQNHTFAVTGGWFGVTGGGFFVDVAWFDESGGFLGWSARITLRNADLYGYERQALTVLAPTGATTGTIRTFGESVVWASSGSRFALAQKHKLELGSVATPFTDDATNGALYRNGINIDDLKPQELGANITETRTSAAISGQGDLATTNKAALPFGANAAINTTFNRGIYGWRAEAAATDGQTVSFGVNRNAGYFGIRNVWDGSVPGALAAGQYFDAFFTKSNWGSGALDDTRLFALPVKDGDRVFASALVAYHRLNDAELFVLTLDATGSFVTFASMNGGVSNGAGNGDPANFQRLSAVKTITATEKYAIIMVRGHGNGGVNPYVFVSEPMLGKLEPGQTAIPAYSPGANDPLGDQTGTNTAAGISGQGAFATLSQAAWATQVTGTGKPEDYATKSLVYRQTTAPASPGVNDIWIEIDGSGIDQAVYAWNGAIWKKGADLTGLNVSLGFAGQGSMSTVTPPTYAGNTAALTAGLMPGDFFNDSSDGNKKKAVVAAGTSAFDVTLDTPLVTGERSGTGPVDSATVTATAVGGSGYSYLWQHLSGDTFTVSNPTDPATYFTGVITSLGQTLDGYYRLTTRDGGSGRVLLRDERILLSENS